MSCPRSGADMHPILRKGRASSMDRNRIAPRLCFASAAVTTLLGTVMRTIAMFTHFDASIGYFDAGLLPSLSDALYFVAVILAVAGAFFIPKDVLPRELCVPHRAFVAWPLGCAMALFTVLLFITSNAELFTKGGTFKTALTLLGLLGSSYFFLSATRKGRYPDWLSAGGFLPILWCMAGVAETYTDAFVTMNSPVKVSLQMGFLGFMLLLVAELRFRLGKALPRVAVAFMSIGIFFSLNAAIPVLAASGILHNALHTLYAGVLLFAGLYGAYLLFRYTCAPGQPDEIPVQAPSAEAEVITEISAGEAEAETTSDPD